MTLLSGRSVAVTVGTTRIRDLDVSFQIDRNIRLEPNTCGLRIYNLAEGHRAALEELRPSGSSVRGIPCRVDAGYGDDLATLWSGDLRTVYSQREGPDWTTVLESGDGEKAVKNGRTNISFDENTPVRTVVDRLVQDLGVGRGNVDRFIATLETASGGIFRHGVTVSEPTAVALEGLADSVDFEVSIQDGALLLLPRGQPLTQGTAVLLSPETGLVDSPTVDNEGVLSARCLLIPDVRIGGLVTVEASRVRGTYRVEQATWFGDTAGNDWFIDLSAVRF